MTIGTYHTAIARIDAQMAADIDAIAAEFCKGRTSDAIRMMLNVGIQYYKNYDHIKNTDMDKILTVDPATQIAMWQKTLSSQEFEGLAHLMQTKHNTRYDEKHELQKEIARLKKTNNKIN